MELDYRLSMSEDDQRRFISIGKETKYGELLNSLKQKQTQGDKNVDFKEQSSSKFVLAQIDKKIMKNTIAAFPIDLSLNSRNVYKIPKSQLQFATTPDRIYDVRFIVPLIYHSVSPSIFVDCRDFIARRCLALALTGLSSEDPQMRALCYKILERYYNHLLSALLIDKQLWINFLDLIRNSIPTSNCRLTFLFTTFLTKIIDVLLHPDKEKLYELIKEFLSGKSRLRIDTIEIYDDLLLCSDYELYGYNLRWLITLFRDGVQCKSDLKVILDLDVIPQAMCLYNSDLRFERANVTICSLFIRIATIPGGSNKLVSEFSFLPWLHHVILLHTNQDLTEIKNDPKAENFASLVESLSSLVFELVDSLLKKREDEQLSLPGLLELISVFMALHDLIIKSKKREQLEYYLKYVAKVAKAIRKDSRLSDELGGDLLDLMKAKMPYL